MQRLRPIRGIRQSRALIAVAAGCLLAQIAVAAPGAAGEKPVIPLIVMDDVPLLDAIKNLARQAGINYIIDPRLTPAFVGADGKSVREPTVTARWENLTANEALTRLLTEREIRLVEDPDTTITRITRSKATRPPGGIDLTTNAANAGNGTNAVIPLVVMDEVPLEDAVRLLAKQAHLNVVFESGLSAASGHRGISSLTVSVRWNSVSGRQALAALLNNYDLVAVPNDIAGDASLTIKPSTGARPSIEEKAGGTGK